jgi:RecA-family ATPase
MGQSGIMSGAGAVGKSTTLLHLCAAHALGVDWLGAVLEKGGALFIDCEDDELALRRRLTAIRNHYKVRFADMSAGGLELISLVGQDAVMATVNRSGKVEPTRLYGELLELAGDLKPKCIAIASSANVYAGNENDRAQVQQFVGLLTKVAIVAGGYLLLAQHPSLTGINNGSGLSGSTQWDNAVRARAYMRGVTSDDEEASQSDLREIVFKKNQYGRKDERIVVKWTDGMFLPVPGVWSLGQAAAEHKADEVFVKLLRRFNDQNQDVNAAPSRGYAPTTFAAHPDAQGLSAKQFSKAMQRLLDTKAITVEITGPPSRQRKRLVVM